ncbi:MAG TPA: signal peptidase I [Abditibacteriaceae bacterium]|jgi:signal peptidase I
MSSATSQPSSSKWVTYAIEGFILVLALALGLTIRLAVLETAIVVSGSMEPTINIGDRLLVDHRATLSGNWKRGDIIFFDAPEDWGGVDTLTKRVIGLPGETVSVEANRVLINGRELPEPYVRRTKPEIEQKLLLRENEYFVMGDNRDNSEDSRELGPVGDKDIHGRAIFRLWPFGRFGRLPKTTYPF